MTTALLPFASPFSPLPQDVKLLAHIVVLVPFANDCQDGMLSLGVYVGDLLLKGSL